MSDVKVGHGRIIWRAKLVGEELFDVLGEEFGGLIEIGGAGTGA